MHSKKTIFNLMKFFLVTILLLTFIFISYRGNQSNNSPKQTSVENQTKRNKSLKKLSSGILLKRLEALSPESEEVNELIYNLSLLDKNKAWKWLESNGNYRLLGLYLAALTKSENIAGVIQFVSNNYDLEFLSPKYRDQDSIISSMVYGAAFVGDTDKNILNWILENPNSDLLGKYVLGISKWDNLQAVNVLNDLGKKGFSVDIPYWQLESLAEKVPEDMSDWAIKYNTEMLDDLVHNWGRHSPEDALIWLTNQTSYDKHKEIIHLLINDRFKDRSQIEEIINEISDPAKKDFFRSLLKSSF